MRTAGRFAFLIVAIPLSLAKPSHAHMTKECLFSIIKLDLTTDAFRRFNTSSAIGRIMGASPKDIAETEALRDAALARKDAELRNLVLCCAPGHPGPLPGCDGTLDPDYDSYGTE